MLVQAEEAIIVGEVAMGEALLLELDLGVIEGDEGAGDPDEAVSQGMCAPV